MFCELSRNGGLSKTRRRRLARDQHQRFRIEGYLLLFVLCGAAQEGGRRVEDKD